MKHSLEFLNVSAFYGNSVKKILFNISFALGPGEHTALLGLNGSGKSTLLFTAAGLLTFEGQVIVADKELNKKTEDIIRENVGFLFSTPEDQIFYSRILDDVAFGLRRRGIPYNKATEEARLALANLGIEHLAEEAPTRISHGQRQRVALAGLLALTPPLLLLDEPSTALDPPGKNALSKILKNLDAAFLMATHDLQFARNTCHRFIILENGNISYDGENPENTLRKWNISAAD